MKLKDIKDCFGIMKDADRLDRVRLKPDQIHSIDGLEIDRLTTITDNEKREEYGKLACESLDSILGILDCEQSLKGINMSKIFLQEMIDKSEVCRGLKGIKAIVSKVKSNIKNKTIKKEDVNQSR